MALTKVRNINASDLSSGTIASARFANDSITPDHLAHTIGHWEEIKSVALKHFDFENKRTLTE